MWYAKNMSRKEIRVKTFAIKYPESVLATLNLSPEVFEEEARIALAVKLYEMGRLTSGQAAELAGIPRVAFLLNCKRYGTSTVEWDREELESEFSTTM
jgi:predicted HTH domain antitoxin